MLCLLQFKMWCANFQKNNDVKESVYVSTKTGANVATVWHFAICREDQIFLEFIKSFIWCVHVKACDFNILSNSAFIFILALLLREFEHFWCRGTGDFIKLVCIKVNATKIWPIICSPSPYSLHTVDNLVKSFDSNCKSPQEFR